MLSDDHQSKDDLDDSTIFKDFSEGKVFRYSRLNISNKQDRTTFGRSFDSSNESNGQKQLPVCDLGKQLLIHSKAGDINKVRILIGRGAPFSTDWLGMSALHFAAMNNNVKVCELLIRGGISKDGRTKVDKTPLHLAAYEGHESVVRLLLEYKCDVNARDLLKMTPLHWAIEKRHKSIAKLLLKHGADVTCISKFDKTPICIAIESGQLDLIDELNAAKESQCLQKTIFEPVQNQQKESNPIIKSITVKLDKKESIECRITNVTKQNTVLEDDNSLSKVPMKHSTVSNYDKDSDADNNDEENKYVEPIVQLENLSDDSREAEATVLELLKSHGISMLPQDDQATNFLSSALKSGRKIVLSEAGKLVLNDTKQKQSDTQEETEKTEDKIKTENNTEKSDMIKKEKKSPIVLKTKGLSLSPGKKVKVISIETLKKMYGEELVNSLKKMRQGKNGKRFITHITKLTRKNQNDESSEKKETLPELKSKILEKLHENTNEDDDLPPNIEICPDSNDQDYDNKTIHFTLSTTENKDETEQNSNLENIHLTNSKDNSGDDDDDDDDNENNYPKQTKLQTIRKCYTNNNKQSFTIQRATNNSNTENKEIILKRKAQSPPPLSSISKKIIVKKLPSTIKKDSNIVPLLNITEICRQLHDLKKLTEELKKCNEEYRIRIEKLEKDRLK